MNKKAENKTRINREMKQEAKRQTHNTQVTSVVSERMKRPF